MDRPKAVIYARVSTGQQDPKRQILELREFAARAGMDVVAEFSEVSSGTRDSRPERKKVLALAQRRDVDVILASELSRWGRSTSDLFRTLEDLNSWGVSLRCLSGGEFDLSSASGRALAGLLAIVSDFEAAMLRERVKSGLARARASGKTLGRKKGDAPVVAKHKKAVRRMVADGRSNNWIARELQIDRKTVAKIRKGF